LIVRANFGAFTTAFAFILIKELLNTFRYAFGIVTPFAFKVTAFKKDCCSYSVAVNE
jgi:hypothetical protein